MAVLVRCPLPGCGRMTGWSYPNFQWAKYHVPGVPPRSFIHDGRGTLGMPRELCEDPFGHVNEFRQRRDRNVEDLRPDVRYQPPPEDPVDDPNADEDDEDDAWKRLSLFDAETPF